MLNAHTAPRTGIAAAFLAAAVLAVGCGSSNSSGTAARTAKIPAGRSTGTVPPRPVSSAPGAPTAFATCMARAGWHVVGNPAIDASARALAVAGAQGLVLITDRHGDRVAAALYPTAQQAEHAQLAAGPSVAGKGHASVAPGAPLAWINYSGRLAVDQKVAACATPAGD
jgi:hypothetical protein